jgi:splicing factor 3B subunit 1
MLSERSRHETNVLISTDIEAQIKDIQERRKAEQAQEEREKGIGLLESGYFDSELYDGNGTQKGKYEGYVTSIAPNEDEDEDDDEPLRPADKRTTGFGAPVAFINDIARVSQNGSGNCVKLMILPTLQSEPDYDPFEARRPKTVGEKEDEYRQKRRKQVLSPARVDPFADGKCRCLHHSLA